jgi:hypothetical protein
LMKLNWIRITFTFSKASCTHVRRSQLIWSHVM